MSDTPIDTPDVSTTTTGGRPPRLARPDNYDGDRARLKAWILQFDRYFHIENDIMGDDQVMFATTFLRGDAEKWASTYLKRYMDNTIVDQANVDFMQNWDQFKTKL
jgi:hypothetical protein